MIYKEVTNIIKDTLSRFKGVNFVRYSGDDLNNAQPNNKNIQCFIDDISHHQFNITQNIAKVEYQIYIIGHVGEDTPDNILDMQDKCYDVALYTLAYLDINETFRGIVSVYDYDILTLSHYTDNNAAGVKLSLVLTIPNGVNLCELDEHFGEPYQEEEDIEITVPDKEVGELDIKPTKLPRNRC